MIEHVKKLREIWFGCMRSQVLKAVNILGVVFWILKPSGLAVVFYPEDGRDMYLNADNT